MCEKIIEPFSPVFGRNRLIMAAMWGQIISIFVIFHPHFSPVSLAIAAYLCNLIYITITT
jgi:hypothetical protein